jgi:hypothetical protein
LLYAFLGQKNFGFIQQHFDLVHRELMQLMLSDEEFDLILQELALVPIELKQ